MGDQGKGACLQAHGQGRPDLEPGRLEDFFAFTRNVPSPHLTKSGVTNLFLVKRRPSEQENLGHGQNQKSDSLSCNPNT
jgi:hypothetical protein